MKTNSLICIMALLLLMGGCAKKGETPAPAPIAEFSLGETKTAGYVYTSNWSTNATKYRWDFGDGSISSEDEPYHAYARNGTYTVTLEATGAGGSNSAKKSITISSLTTGGGGIKTGRALFFTGQKTGWTSITVSVEGSEVGTIPGTYFSVTPNCGDYGTITISRPPGTYAYSAKSNTNASWTGTLIITDNGCQPVRLDFPDNGTSQTGSTAFWTAQSSGWSSIDISIGGSVVGTINGSYFTSQPACGATGTVTVTRPPGTYAYSARSNTGATWSGNITIAANQCNTLRLDFPVTTNQTGQVAFFTTKSSGWSTITVTLAGSSGVIAGKYFTNAALCGVDGTVTFTKSPGTYTYSARSNTGATWSGSITIAANQCSTLRLDF